jgi:hypothetical protein
MVSQLRRPQYGLLWLVYRNLINLQTERWHTKLDHLCRIILLILSCIWVTIDRVWIGDSIYCTLWYNEWLCFTVHCYTHIHQCPQLHLHSHCLVVASPGRRSPSSGFLNYPCASANSSQRLNCIGPLTACLLTNQLTSLHYAQLHCTHYLNWSQSSHITLDRAT